MSSGGRLNEALERIAVGAGNSAKRGWVVKLGRSLVASDGATASLDWRTRLWAARYGFLPYRYVLYDLAANGIGPGVKRAAKTAAQALRATKEEEDEEE